MSFQGRSLDDMPLAAYSRGAVRDEDEVQEQLDQPGPATPGSSLAASTPHDPGAAGPAPAAATAAAATTGAPGRRLTLRFKLPSLRRPKAADGGAGAAGTAGSHAEVEPPFHAVSPSVRPAQPTYIVDEVAYGVGHGVGQAPADEPHGQLWRPRTADELKDAGRRRLDPNVLLRNPRVLFGGIVVIGVALLGLSILNGGGPTSGSNADQSQGPGGAIATPAPGDASVEVTSGKPGLFELTGSTGVGPAVDSQVDSTWTDALGNTLGLAGMASAGTRTTAVDFVLTWTMVIDGATMTFTSTAAECTVGMAVGMKVVNGTFVCKKLASDDGRLTIDVKGSYRT